MAEIMRQPKLEEWSILTILHNMSRFPGRIGRKPSEQSEGAT